MLYLLLLNHSVKYVLIEITLMREISQLGPVLLCWLNASVILLNQQQKIYLLKARD